MADFHLDHENTSLYPTAYMAAPSGPSQLPQEGDGAATGSGAAPASASASWDLTAASASSGTMTIMGATVTGLNGSGATLASAIATAINASTASAASVTTGNISAVYLRAVVWAQASGATLNVYSRIASASLNYATNTACAMAAGSGWTSPPSVAQFSGGVSGPWRYFVNESALAAAVSGGVSGAIATYGGFLATVMGNPGVDDVSHIRTKRGGSNITCRTQTNTNMNIGSTRSGKWLADAGVKWSGNDGQFKLTLASTHGSVTLGFTITNGMVDGNGERLWVVFQDIASNFLGAGVVAIATGSQHYRGIKYEIHSSAGGTSVFSAFVNTGARAKFSKCRFIVSRLNSYGSMFGQTSNPNQAAMLEMEDCDVVFTGLLSAPSSKVFLVTRANNFSMALLLRNIRIYDQNNLSIKFPLVGFYGSAGTGGLLVKAEGVGGVSVLPADYSVGLTGSSAPNAYDIIDQGLIAMVSSVDGALRVERLNGYSDWLPGQSFPTLSAVLPDGTPWSIRSLWYGQYLGDTRTCFAVAADQVYDQAASALEITAHLLFDATIADGDITRDRVVCVLSYTGEDGVFRVEDTTENSSVAPSQLAAGSGGWAGLSGDYLGWKPRKLVLTTAHPVKQNTNLYLRVEFRKVCPTSLSGKHVFFDPEFGVVQV